MRIRLGRAAVAAVMLGCASWEAALAHDHAPLRGRLVFADHEKPVLRILDLDTGEVTHSFDLTRPAFGLAAAEDGRHVVVRTGDPAGTIRIFDSGLASESHGDHDDIVKVAPKLLDLSITGQKPAHVVSANGEIALFYDGEKPWEAKSEPKAVLVNLKSLSGREPRVRVWTSPGPQHGIVVPLGGDELLLSLPNAPYATGEDRAASSRPDGFKVVRAVGKPEAWKTLVDLNDPSRADASCRRFHGYAAVGRTHVFGCDGGEGGALLVLSRQGKKWSARKLPYADERRASSIKGAGRTMVANLGTKSPYTSLVRIDPAAKSLKPEDILAVPGDQPGCQFELSGDGKRLANLTPDGKLRIYEMQPAWKELASFDAVPAFDCAYAAPTPTPNLAVKGDLAFVSDPLGGRIREYGLKTLKQGLDLPVEGKPTAIAGGASGG
jgi:hypothetical protein